MSEYRNIKIAYRPVFHVVIDHFLGVRTNQEIFRHVIDLKPHFREAEILGRGTGAVVKEIRSNLTCYIDELFDSHEFELPDGSKDVQKLRAYRAQSSPLLRAVDTIIQSESLRSMMDNAPFPLCKLRQMNTWVTQVSRYGDDEGQFYAWHQDRARKADKRTVTMTYYIFKEPRRFSGGQLCLTNGLLFRNNLVGSKDDVVAIQPRNDRLVIFGSRTVHCVKPTRSPLEFEDGRFSVSIFLGKDGGLDPGDIW